MTNTDDRKKINLGIGGILVLREPALVTTVLGSCISICLFDEEKAIAGINHYMLSRPADGKPSQVGRFGQTSIPELIARMVREGATPARMKAKIFGGAHMLTQIASFNGIAESNIAVAKQLLEEYRIRVVATDVGGTRGRKIMFQTDTGRVFVRQVESKQTL